MTRMRTVRVVHFAKRTAQFHLWFEFREFLYHFTHPLRRRGFNIKAKNIALAKGGEYSTIMFHRAGLCDFESRSGEFHSTDFDGKLLTDRLGPTAFELMPHATDVLYRRQACRIVLR